MFIITWTKFRIFLFFAIVSIFIMCAYTLKTFPLRLSPANITLSACGSGLCAHAAGTAVLRSKTATQFDQSTLAEGNVRQNVSIKNSSSTDKGISTAMRVCSDPPPGLVGRLNVSLTLSDYRLPDTEMAENGSWKPRDCVARHRVAIIIPYRDRAKHLTILLYYLIPILKRQLVDFRIFVVEQAGNETFNKGRLMNAGFKEAMNESDFQCVIFHDVDLVPEDDRNMYTCFAFPWHMSVAIDKFKYKLPYSALIGGVLNMRKDIYTKVNGFTNLLWGWGSEDDEMEIRIKKCNLRLHRPSVLVARYKNMNHDRREQGEGKWRKLLTQTVGQRYKKDGLTSVRYTVNSRTYNHTFTHLVVDIGRKPDVMPDIRTFQ